VFLVDTDVISDTAPTKAAARAEALAWLAAHREDLFLSTITIAELRRGVAFLYERGDRKKAAILDGWERGLVKGFSDRILMLDHAAAHRAGELFGAAEARGHNPSLADACIAALADVRGFTVVTFNTRHFQALRVRNRRPGTLLGEDND
jgi:toxin FitB